MAFEANDVVVHSRLGRHNSPVDHDGNSNNITLYIISLYLKLRNFNS